MHTRFIVSAIIAGLIGTAGIARADHERDAEGWTMLGEVGVDDYDESDWIEVPHRARYSQLAIEVVRGEVDIEAVTVRFANGKAWTTRPSYEHFDRHSRSPLIDLPGNGRRIDSVELDFRDQDRGRNARVQVWALESDRPNHYQTGNWDTLSDTIARRRTGTLTVRLGGARYSALAFQTDPDVEIRSVVIAYAGGRRVSFRPDEGEAPVIELGDNRRIRSVMVRYVNRSRYRNPQIQLYGMR